MTISIPRIRYWSYLEEYSAHRDDYLRAVDSVFSSGRLILGQQVATFEDRFAAYCGVPCAVGVNSCTDALFLALKALDIGPGDEVITVANTAVPTVAAIRATGAKPAFVDVEEDTFLMDVTQLDRAVTRRTRCILPVHLFGQMVDMLPLREYANRYSLSVVEDCAQACGATYNGCRAGSLGDAGAFSFYPTKVLGTFGDGGAVTTSRPELALRLKRLRMYGMENAYYAEEEGYNTRLDEVQAAILNVKLPGLDPSVERRRRIAEIYDDGLAGIDGLSLPAVREGRSHQRYLYTIRTARRDELQRYLAGEGIETKVNYPDPIHLMRGYRFLGYAPGSLPVTERLAATILSLPMYPELPNEQAAEVVAAVRRFYA
ncbi:MAG: DegT/DnrJ/EryC1/StrS family aminotransferase [Desulfuromonadaceae bacterium]|nr:DegT/DnrJ/EryC1/StrS family aminotransferase [Desulfuromonadaceae bacterium]